MAKKILGLDCGEKHLKGVEIVRRGRTKIVSALGTAALPPGALADGFVVDKDAVETALGNLLKKNDFSAKSTVLGLGGPSVTVKTHRFPSMNERELERALQFELPDLVNFPVQSLDEVIYDYYVNLRTATEVEVVLAACTRSLLYSFLPVCRGAGLVVEAVDLPALNWPLIPLTEKRRAFVDIQESWTTIFVELASVFKVLRVVPLGAVQFRRGVQEAFQCSEKEAQKLCAQKHIDYLLLQGSGNKGPLRAAAQQFLGSVLQTLDFLRAQERASRFGEVVDEVLLLGDFAHLKGLPQLLQQEIDLPVAPLDPFQKVRQEPDLILPENGAGYASALALALRGV